jgi:hypothetical protein
MAIDRAVVSLDRRGSRTNVDPPRCETATAKHALEASKVLQTLLRTSGPLWMVVAVESSRSGGLNFGRRATTLVVRAR